jgi:3-oxoacyl-[acyl-carrier protein] reductase
MKNILLVTGAVVGSGRAIAERFAREGYDVAVTSRERERAEAAADQIAKQFDVRCLGFSLQQGDPVSVDRLFASLADTQMLPTTMVLNAANLGLDMDPFLVTAVEWNEIITTNLTGAFLMCRSAAQSMRIAGCGAIVIVGSNTCRRAIRGRSAYIASKGGLVSLTKALAVEFGSYGIRVNCLIPGSIKSERWLHQTDEWRELRRKRTPIGDIAGNEDIADGAWYLGSSQSRVVTGSELVIDGGVDAQLIPGF